MVHSGLSIAGSDSSGGAGIQADIKTMSALGIYSCTVITAITAQSTSKVDDILPMSSQIVKKQIESVLEDIPINAIKIGMVFNNEIITAVSDILNQSKIPIVLDPIVTAGTGAQLLQKEFVNDFKSKLVPICDVITPNIHEAEMLSGIKIKTEKDIKNTASKIQELGAKNVIVKGGHFRNDSETIFDIVLDEKGKFTVFKNPRMKFVETHGSGCNFSAAVTSFLAMKYPVVNACFLANKYVHRSIVKTVKIGKGIPVNNPISTMYEDSCRYQVIEELGRAVENLVNMKNFADLIPETQSNLAYAIPDAKGLEDVAGVNGRIVKAGNKGVPTSGIKFGVSKHVGSSILEYMKINQMVRSALNIRNDKSILNKCRKLFSTSYYERNFEPKVVKESEGNSIPWGIKKALLKNPDADIIYHLGDFGKEPMIIIFGQNPQDVLDKVKKILDNRNVE